MRSPEREWQCTDEGNLQRSRKGDLALSIDGTVLNGRVAAQNMKGAGKSTVMLFKRQRSLFDADGRAYLCVVCSRNHSSP